MSARNFTTSGCGAMALNQPSSFARIAGSVLAGVCTDHQAVRFEFAIPASAALGTSGKQRSDVLPEVPTLQEAGVPNYEFNSWVGILVPASTPPAIVTRLNEHVVKAARSPAVLLEAGVIVNRDEELALVDERSHRNMAEALAEGIGRCACAPSAQCQ